MCKEKRNFENGIKSRRNQLNEINTLNLAKKEADGTVENLLSNLSFIHGCEDLYNKLRSLFEQGNKNTRKLATRFYEANANVIEGCYIAQNQAAYYLAEAVVNNKKTKKHSRQPIPISEWYDED